MRALTIITCLALSLSAQTTLAQEGGYEADDAKIMIKCLDGVAAALTGDEAPLGDAAPRLEDCIGAAANICMEQPDGYTTVGMSACMARETAWWDEKLNADYAELRDTLDAEAFSALREAQRAWIGFREAECNFHYSYWRDGTIRSTFFSSCMLDLTARRAIGLETFLGWAL